MWHVRDLLHFTRALGISLFQPNVFGVLFQHNCVHLTQFFFFFLSILWKCWQLNFVYMKSCLKAIQPYCSELPFPSLGDLPDPGIELTYPTLAGRFFTTESYGKPQNKLKF